MRMCNVIKLTESQKLGLERSSFLPLKGGWSQRPLEIIQSNPLPRQGHLEQFTQEHIHVYIA